MIFHIDKPLSTRSVYGQLFCIRANKKRFMFKGELRMNIKEIAKYDLDTWASRRLLLMKFQAELLEIFPAEDYNVFVFGSYIRNDFNSETSDIDLIVYSDNSIERGDIVEFCKKYFQELELPSDVLEYYYSRDAYIFAQGILNSIHLTDYYPDRLKNELYIISTYYSRYMKEAAIKNKYMHWAYVLNKYELNKERGNDGRDS